MDGGAYGSEARSWSDTPSCTAAGGQNMAAGFDRGGGGEEGKGGGEVTSYKEN